MRGSRNYSIRRTPKFEQTLKQLLKSAYPKSKPSKELIDGLYLVLEVLSTDPRFESLCRREPSKHLNIPPGCELWKVAFDLPGVRGALQAARIIYLICEARREVILVWAYSHKQFEGRPPHRDLKKALKVIAEMLDA